MVHSDGESDIIALQSALRAVGIPLTHEQIAIHIDRPFLLVGSEEWLDRTTLQLFPRMQTVLPADLLAFRLEHYRQLRALGVNLLGTWCADAPALTRTLDGLAREGMACMIICNTDGPLPVVRYTGSTWISADASIAAWDTQLVGASQPNGYYVISLEREEGATADSLADRITRARKMLTSPVVFRFPTPNHPLRIYQAWHTGIASLAVIAYAAKEAAPLSIVSDTVAQVFARFHGRAMQSINVVTQWEKEDGSREKNTSLYEDIRSKYLDIVYLFELVCTQFPKNGPVRALSLAEGALIAEVCTDARLVYGELCELLERLEKAV
ncbi:MAG: hypothetical protein RLY87_2467 [Chloroflexota bacterium]|jgi:hypothetical protein